ncbi:hypothetical protein J3F83DRAFT_545884 [Trichoderma novae-zelandiae]
MPHPERRYFLTRKHGVTTQGEIERPTRGTKKKPPVDNVEESVLSRVWTLPLTIGSKGDNLRCRAQFIAPDSAANPLVSVEEPQTKLSPRYDHTSMRPLRRCRDLSCSRFGTPPSGRVLAGRPCAYEYWSHTSTKHQLREMVVARGSTTVRA